MRVTNISYPSGTFSTVVSELSDEDFPDYTSDVLEQMAEMTGAEFVIATRDTLTVDSIRHSSNDEQLRREYDGSVHPA